MDVRQCRLGTTHRRHSEPQTRDHYGDDPYGLSAEIKIRTLRRVGLVQVGDDAFGPQPHPNFIEVFCPAALHDGSREVAGACTTMTQTDTAACPDIPANPRERLEFCLR